MAGDPTRSLVARLVDHATCKALDEEPRPEAGPDEVLVPGDRRRAVRARPPLVRGRRHRRRAVGSDRLVGEGHEIAGIVDGGPTHGQRVEFDPVPTMRGVSTCLAGHPKSRDALRRVRTDRRRAASLDELAPSA